MTSTKNIIRLDPLTSLRFFAAAMIVLGHSHPLFGSFGLATNFSLSQGVSFFFTLSGFILAYNYSSLPDSSSAKRFVVSRFARIWPLHIATLLLWIILITPSISMEFSDPYGAIVKLIANITLLQSWTFTAPYVLSFNGVAWSISTEAFFYAAFVVIALSPRKRLPIALALSAVITAAFIYASTVIPLSSDDGAPGASMFGALYTNPLARILEFLFGVYCARFYKSKSGTVQNISPAAWLAIEIAALSSIVYALYLVAKPAAISQILGAGMGYYIYKEGIWFLWGVLILVFACSRGPIARLLSIKPLVFLGEISFALYLVHMIVFNLASLNQASIRELGSFGMVLFWAVCIASAAALHITVEEPFRRLIVNWWDGKPNNKLSRLFKAPQLICLAMIIGGSAYASSYQPSTVVGIGKSVIADDVNAVTTPSNSFSSGVSLTNVSISPPKNGEVEIVLYFTTIKEAKLNKHVGVHLNGPDGKIIKVIGDIFVDRSSTTHEKGFSWLDKITIKESDLNGVSSLGIAVFENEKNLEEVASGFSDWDGKRLIVQINKTN